MYNASKRLKLAILIIFLSGAGMGYVFGFSDGPIPGAMGAPLPPGSGLPAEITCNSAECHTSFPINSDARGVLAMQGVPDNYILGRRYTIGFSISHPDTSRRRWGFEATAIGQEDLRGAGTFEITDQTNTQLKSGLGGPAPDRQYVQHTLSGTARNKLGGTTWTFDWIAPPTNVGDVGFYAAGNAANGDSSSLGDRIYTKSPLPLAVAKGQFIFRNVAPSAGIPTIGNAEIAAMADFDNDGFVHVFLTEHGRGVLLKNNGDGTFSDLTNMAELGKPDLSARAAAWGDFDGNSFVDLYLTCTGSDLLFRNNGNSTFTDVSSQAGISDQEEGRAVVWGDLNGDARLDLYVANDGQDILYVNNGDGTFLRADPDRAGLREQSSGRSVALADFNGDGRQDSFVANDGQDFLFRNDGDVTFTNLATSAGIVTAGLEGRAAAWSDYNLDGKPDLFVGNAGQDLLYKNNGDGTFTEVSTTAGFVDTAAASAAVWADYDKDGDPDLFVANAGPAFLYRNNGDGTFNEVASFSGIMDEVTASGASWFDFDNDGYSDLWVGTRENGALLYMDPGRRGPTSMATAQAGSHRAASSIKVANRGQR